MMLLCAMRSASELAPCRAAFDALVQLDAGQVGLGGRAARQRALDTRELGGTERMRRRRRVGLQEEEGRVVRRLAEGAGARVLRAVDEAVVGRRHLQRRAP